MNDLVKQILGDKAPELIAMLTSKLGIGDGKAEGFLDAIVEQAAGLLQGGDLDLSGLLGGGQELLDKLDAGELADRAGLSVEQARDGLDTIGPALTEKLGEARGGLGDALGGLLGGDGGNDLLGGLGKLFGK